MPEVTLGMDFTRSSFKAQILGPSLNRPLGFPQLCPGMKTFDHHAQNLGAEEEGVLLGLAWTPAAWQDGGTAQGGPFRGLGLHFALHVGNNEHNYSQRLPLVGESLLWAGCSVGTLTHPAPPPVGQRTSSLLCR